MHIHVGANIPGYLPELDVTCFDSVDGVLEALRHELKDQQEFYYEGCPAQAPEQREKGSECCDWCDVAGDVEAALSHIADADAANQLNNGQGVLYVFNPPEGASVAHWAMFADGDRDSCEIAQEQDD